MYDVGNGVNERKKDIVTDGCMLHDLRPYKVVLGELKKEEKKEKKKKGEWLFMYHQCGKELKT